MIAADETRLDASLAPSNIEVTAGWSPWLVWAEADAQLTRSDVLHSA
jgi:hypothetical protein